MDIYDRKPYKFFKNCAVLIGVWPYQSNLVRRISWTLYYFANFTFLAPQTVMFFQKLDDFDVVMSVIGVWLFSLNCIGKYQYLYSNRANITILYEQIAKQWQTITEAGEVAILKKKMNEAYFLEKIYTSVSLAGFLIYSLFPYTPWLLDKMFPLANNATRAKIIPYYANFIFFDITKYHYLAVTHALFTYSPWLIVLFSVDNSYLYTLKHMGALFAIVSKRLHDAVTTDANAKTPEDRALVKEKIKNTVLLHDVAIDGCRLLENSYSYIFLASILILTALISLESVYALYADDKILLLRIMSVIGGCISHLFFANLVSQEIIDNSSGIFDEAYFSDWYMASIGTRTSIGIILLKSIKPEYFTAGKFIEMSNATFGNIVRSIISYITIFYSLMDRG